MTGNGRFEVVAWASVSGVVWLVGGSGHGHGLSCQGVCASAFAFACLVLVLGISAARRVCVGHVGGRRASGGSVGNGALVQSNQGRAVIDTDSLFRLDSGCSEASAPLERGSFHGDVVGGCWQGWLAEVDGEERRASILW